VTLLSEAREIFLKGAVVLRAVADTRHQLMLTRQPSVQAA